MLRRLAPALLAAAVTSTSMPARAEVFDAPLVMRALRPTGGGGGAAAPKATPAPAPAPAPAPGPTPTSPGNADAYATPVAVAGIGDLAGNPTQADLPTLLETAVRQAPALASATIDVEVAAAQLESTMGLDDWQLSGRLTGSGTPGSFFGSSGNSRSATGTLGLTKPLTTGGSVTVGFESDYSHRNFSLAPGVSATTVIFDDILSVNLYQPLMKGRGRAVARAIQVEDRITRDAAVLTRRQQAISVVQTIVSAYWDLVAAERNLEIAKSSLQLAQERLRVTQVGVRGGKIADSELLAVEEAIATRQEDVLNAEVAVFQQGLVVRRDVGMEIGPGQLALGTGADLTIPVRQWDLNDLIGQAMQTSPQLAALADQDQAASIQVEVTENGLLPQLDLSLTAGPEGVSNSFAPALEEMVKLSGFSVSGTLSYTQTLTNHQVQGQTRAARAQREKIRITAVDVRLQIAQAMAQAVALVKAAEQRVALGARAVELAKKNILVEQSRFELGKSTNFDVLLRQDDLRQAELREARAQVDWHKAQAVIAGVSGSILSDYGIRLDDR